MAEGQSLIRYGQVLTETALRLPPGLAVDDWMVWAKRITTVGHGYWWWVGDLAEYATRCFGRQESADALAALADATGAGIKYVRLVGHASKAYPSPQRIPGLSVTHHLIALAVKNKRSRRQILERAAERGWSTRFLRERITPAQEREELFIARFPAGTLANAKFAREANTFVEAWHGRRLAHHGPLPAASNRRRRGAARVMAVSAAV